MKKFERSCLLICVFSLLVFVFAKVLADPISQSFLIRPWAIGQTITLQTKTFRDGNLINIENLAYSIVGEETISGKNYFWVEIERSGSSGVRVTKKIQVRQPETIDFENVLSGNFSVLKSRRRIQQINLGRENRRSSLSEFEVSAESVSQIENDPAPTETEDLTGSYSSIPGQTISVQAGTFKTTHFQRLFPDGNTPAMVPTKGSSNKSKDNLTPNAGSSLFESWGTPEVPIWGIVKKTSQFTALDHATYSQETELVSYKNLGAVSKIKSAAHFVPLSLQKHLAFQDSGLDQP